MSSGYGIRGGIGRCYPFWADFKECMAVSISRFEHDGECDSSMYRNMPVFVSFGFLSLVLIVWMAHFKIGKSRF